MRFFKYVNVYVVTFLLSISGLSLATDQCGPDAVDPDGDGWGWEDGKSCRVGEINPPHPFCKLSESDPDGDGYGWENGQTCRQTKYLPGDSPESAPTVPLNSVLSAAIAEGTSDHYYKLELTNASLVRLDASFDINSSDIRLFLNDEFDNMYFSSAAVYLEERCLPKGDYYLILQPSTRFVELPINYTVNVSTTVGQTCLGSPTKLDDIYGVNRYVTSTGLVFGWQYDPPVTRYLVKYDFNGDVLWETAIEERVIRDVESFKDGSVAILGSNALHYLNSNGQLLWTVSEIPEHTHNIFAGTSVVVLNSSNRFLQAINIADGSEQWRYDFHVFQGLVNDLVFTDTGKLVLDMVRGVLMFDENTGLMY